MKKMKNKNQIINNYRKKMAEKIDKLTKIHIQKAVRYIGGLLLRDLRYKVSLTKNKVSGKKIEMDIKSIEYVHTIKDLKKSILAGLNLQINTPAIIDIDIPATKYIAGIYFSYEKRMERLYEYILQKINSYGNYYGVSRKGTEIIGNRLYLRLNGKEITQVNIDCHWTDLLSKIKDTFTDCIISKKTKT